MIWKGETRLDLALYVTHHHEMGGGVLHGNIQATATVDTLRCSQALLEQCVLCVIYTFAASMSKNQKTKKPLLFSSF